MKRILVTGGCGFVGRHLIRRLAADSDAAEIWVVDDLSTGRDPDRFESPRLTPAPSPAWPEARHYRIEASAARLTFLRADLTALLLGELRRQRPLTARPLPHFDEVYHLASVVGGRALIEGDPLAVGIDLSIDSTFFLWAAHVNRPGRILYASSSAAYPTALQRGDADVALRESMIDFDSGFLQPDLTYGWSKLTGEYLARTAARHDGLSVAVVRPFSGYGEDQDDTYPVPAIALRVAARDDPVLVWGSGEQGRDFVHIDDCVEACVRACRRISDGSAVNVGSGELTSFRDLATRMIRIEGYSGRVEGVEGRPVGVARRYCDATRMAELLEWRPGISLDQGLGRVLAGAHRRLQRRNEASSEEPAASAPRSVQP